MALYFVYSKSKVYFKIITRMTLRELIDKDPELKTHPANMHNFIDFDRFLHYIYCPQQYCRNTVGGQE